ncbi:MAG: lytic transglycosylase domain-containing protein [Muribaculaceae bacterium]|nr:lytic transglycosylase domain-containing protein [Muribaculaceae bacterium]
MKRHKILISFILLAASVSAQRLPAQFSDVYSPEIPASVTLCGATIDLDPVDRYERFDRELTSQIYRHGSTMLMLKRANKYFPIIAPILKANGVPADVIYLACAESSLNPRAYSPAKAAGLWQFLAATAKQYGLEVNDEIDERYNVEKATQAACRYLKQGLEKYGDWPTVMASYNAGMGRISTELDKQLADNSFDLYLNDETSRYVFRIMAIKALMENPAAFGYQLNPNQLYRNVDCKIVEVSGPVEDWATWAQQQGITYAQLKEENHWIRALSLTNKAGKT